MRVEDATALPEQHRLAHKNQWVVLEGGMAYDYFNTKEEANEICDLLNKTEEVLEDIQYYVTEKYQELTPKQQEFFKSYTKGEMAFNF